MTRRHHPGTRSAWEAYQARERRAEQLRRALRIAGYLAGAVVLALALYVSLVVFYVSLGAIAE